MDFICALDKVNVNFSFEDFQEIFCAKWSVRIFNNNQKTSLLAILGICTDHAGVTDHFVKE